MPSVTRTSALSPVTMAPPVTAPVSEYSICFTPDPESEACRLTVTLDAFQPFAFGAGAALAVVVGATTSR